MPAGQVFRTRRRLLFPYPAASPDLPGLIDAFLATSRDTGLTRVLTETRDVVVRALRPRALPATLPA
jgi:hypothetical protein